MSANHTAVFSSQPVTSNKTLSIDNGAPSGDSSSSSSSGSSAKMFAIGFAVGGTILIVVVVVILLLQNRKTALKRQFKSMQSRSSKRPLTKARASPADSPSTMSRARSSPATRSHSHGPSPSHKLGYTSVPVEGSPRHNGVSPAPPAFVSQSQGSRESHMYNNPDLPWLHLGRDSVASKTSHTYSNPDLPGQPWHDGSSDSHLYNDPNYRSTDDYDHLADVENVTEASTGNESGEDLHYAASRLPTDQLFDEDVPYGTTSLERARSLTRLPHSFSPKHQAHRREGQLPLCTHRRSSSLGQSWLVPKQTAQLNWCHLTPLRATASLSNLVDRALRCKTPSVSSLKGLGRSPVHQTPMIRESSKEDESTHAQWEEAVYYKSSNILPSFSDNSTRDNSPGPGVSAADNLDIDAAEVKVPKVKVDPGYVFVNIRRPLPNDGSSKHSSKARKDNNTNPGCTPSEKPPTLSRSSPEPIESARQAVVVNVIHRPLLQLVSSEPMVPLAANDQAHPLESITTLVPTQLAAKHTETPMTSNHRRLCRENALAEGRVGDAGTIAGQLTLDCTEQSLPEKQESELAHSEGRESQPQARGEHDYWVLESPDPTLPTQAV